MKRKIDIEKLLQWALREELPKGRPVSMSPWEIIMSYGRLGARIEASGGGVDQFGFVPGAPHEDALTIASEVGALPVDARLADDDDIRMLYADRTLPACVPADWIVPLRAARFNARDIVVSKATTGRRPPWRFDGATPHQCQVQERNAAGAWRDVPLVEGVDDDGCLVRLVAYRSRTQRGLYDIDRLPRSPLTWGVPSPLKVAEARGEYLAWHAALVSLVDVLRDRLQQFEPTHPAVAWRPWIDGETPPSRILRAGDDMAAIEPLPVAPRRPRAGPPVRKASEYESAAWRAAMAERRLAGNPAE